jgi:hypothetical protein
LIAFQGFAAMRFLTWFVCDFFSKPVSLTFEQASQLVWAQPQRCLNGKAQMATERRLSSLALYIQCAKFKVLTNTKVK